jgi:integrase
MTRLEMIINTVLDRLKPDLAEETWKSRRRYFKQMLRCAEVLGVTEPCTKLYDAFIADDHGSPERRELHIRCVKMVDAEACTGAKDSNGILFNEPPLPAEDEVREFFEDYRFPIGPDIPIDNLIVKTELEMRHLNLSASTMGQYRHSWLDIRRFLQDAGSSHYAKSLVMCFIQDIDSKRDSGQMKLWKWKINGLAAHALMEVADTGTFQWKTRRQKPTLKEHELEHARLQYLEYLRQRNLGESTIALHDYVFRKFIALTETVTLGELHSLSPEKIQRAILEFSGFCNKRSLSTILPILRSELGYCHGLGLIQKDLTGVVMAGLVRRGSVATYIEDKDQVRLLAQLEKESKRTKAIVLLAMRLGLRDSDICNLTFQSVDWSNDKITLIQTKTGEPLVLPLVPEVGNAVMDYILEERPRENDRSPYIFLRKQAPFTKLTSVYSICSKLLKRLDIKPVNGGAAGGLGVDGHFHLSRLPL